ncbi:MAG: PQQ-binding-like beta-propeller repeat protein [Dehalococcoidales bacterium]|nr:PQQ-binding-like beta-propeller repeat protein [Dehalococcoidales bacterium]
MRKNKGILLGKALLIAALLVVILSSASCVSRTGASGWSGSTVDSGTVYVASAGSLAAINSSNGVAKWERGLPEDASSGGASCGTGTASSVVYANPVVDNGIVYLGTYSGKIHAFNVDNGNLLWTYPSEGYVQGIIGGLLINNGIIYFGAVGGVVAALNIATQEIVWHYDTGDTLWALPSISGDTLYIASFDKKLYALDIGNGEEKWSEPFQTNGPIITAPVFSNGTIYIGSLDRSLYAIDEDTGEKIWSFSTGSSTDNPPEKWFWATPVIANGYIYAPNMDGHVYVLDVRDGKLVTTLDLGNSVSSSPILLSGKVVVATQDGRIYSINTENQSSILIKSLGMTVISSLTGSDGIIYIHTKTEEKIYAVNAESGVTIWQYEID